MKRLREQKRKSYDWLKEHRQKKKPRRFYQRLPVGLILFWLVLGGIALGALVNEDFSKSPGNAISCYNPYIIDGDTIDCGGHRVRLANIDAPEISDCRPGRECVSGDPYAAKDYLQSLTRGKVTCIQSDMDHYGRIIALCEAQERDLSCAMVDANHAIERYGHLRCQ